MIATDQIRDALKGTMPDQLGIEVLDVQHGRAVGRMRVDRRHLHPGGFAHSASIACLADSAAAWATVAMLEEGQGFSTIEFKSNFFTPGKLGDMLVCESVALHAGRSTIVLESKVTDQDGRLVSAMIVTQAVMSRDKEATDG